MKSHDKNWLKLMIACLFILPLTLTMINLKYIGAFVCAAATFAAIQEGHYIRSGSDIGNDKTKIK